VLGFTIFKTHVFISCKRKNLAAHSVPVRNHEYSQTQFVFTGTPLGVFFFLFQGVKFFTPICLNWRDELVKLFDRRRSGAPDELRGNQFIGSHVLGSDRITTPRTCFFCFYGNHEKGPVEDCLLRGKQAKKDFGVAGEEPMPDKIDGESVGHYCAHWLDFMAE